MAANAVAVAKLINADKIGNRPVQGERSRSSAVCLESVASVVRDIVVTDNHNAFLRSLSSASVVDVTSELSVIRSSASCQEMRGVSAPEVFTGAGTRDSEISYTRDLNVDGCRDRRNRPRDRGRDVVAPQVATVHRATDGTSEPGPLLLIESEMDPTVDAGVVDIVGDLLEFGIPDRHRRSEDHGRQRDRMAPGSIDALEHLGPAVAPARVV